MKQFSVGDRVRIDIPDATQDYPPSEVLIRGAFHPNRILDLIRYFVLYSDEDGQLSKKLAAYHQYYAVNNAIESSKTVVTNPDENRVGVVWHTQGSGKSLSMVFYANKVRQTEGMRNPTLVFLTDRNDLDEQLFKEFKKHGLAAEWADNDNRVELRTGWIGKLAESFSPRFRSFRRRTRRRSIPR